MFVVPKQSLIQFLSALNALVKIGLSEKQALDVLEERSSFKHSYIAPIRHDLNNGLTFVQSVSDILQRYSFLICEVSNIGITHWIHFKVEELQRQRDIYLLLVKKSLKPFLLMILAGVLNGFIIMGLIPKIASMLVQFNAPYPKWLGFYQDIFTLFNRYGLFIVVVILCFNLLFLSSVKHFFYFLISPVKQDFMIKEFLAMIESLSSQGMSLKKIASLVDVKNSKDEFNNRFVKFRSMVLQEHSYQKAFHILLQNKQYEHVVEQGIIANKLDFAMRYIIKSYQDRFISFVEKCSSLLTLFFLVITALCILMGFYITLQPFIQLLEFAL